MFLGTDGDAVGDYSAEDLADAVEAEPDVDAAALFCFCIPLFGTVLTRLIASVRTGMDFVPERLKVQSPALPLLQIHRA